MCRVLTEHGVRIAPSTYHAAKHRPPSARALRDEEVLVEIRRVHRERRIGRGLYGARKVWNQLRQEHERGERQLGPVPRCQVERLMRADGLRGARRGGKRFVTTKADPSASRPGDLVQRQFAAAAPNRLWVVDFTYVATWEQMGYTAFVHDVCSHRIIGWRTAAAMPTELPLDALEMAIWIRARNGEPIDGVIHHSDAGSQYTAIRYMLRLDDVGALASIGSIGDSYDNAMAESLIGLYKTECVALDGPFRTVTELELATCDWVHWFNYDRLHSAIGYRTPVEFEEDYYRQINHRQQQLSA
jgi:putative transposase